MQERKSEVKSFQNIEKKVLRKYKDAYLNMAKSKCFLLLRKETKHKIQTNKQTKKKLQGKMHQLPKS